MSDERDEEGEGFNGERLLPSAVEVGLLAMLAVIVAIPFVLGLQALVVVAVLLAIAVMAVIVYLARGGPTTAGGG
jgi:hypothetical protein